MLASMVSPPSISPKRYLDALDALCGEIGMPVYLLEDYSLHKGTTGEARNYYVKRQQRNRRLSAVIFFNASPFFSAVIRVGLLFLRVPFNVELEEDYAAAVKTAVALQNKAYPAVPRAIEARAGGTENTFDWGLENGAFSVTYKLLPGNVLFSISRGSFRTAEEVREFQTVLSRVLREWILPGNEYFRLMEWTGFKYATMKARSLYADCMKDLQKEYPCKLAVLYGMSSFARAAFTVSKPFLPSVPIITASDFDEGLSKIRSFASSRSLSPVNKKRPGELSFSRPDFDLQLRNLIDYIGTINWEQSKMEIETPAFDGNSPFKPVYEALMVLKQDYGEIMREKQASESQQRELEEKLRHSEKMQAIGQLAGGIAHDFNNQLAAIMGFAELLKYKSSNSDDVALYADTILQTSRRAADLTAQLLAFARKGKYLSVDVDVHKLIDEVMAMLEHSIDKRVVLRKDLAAPSSVIAGDPGQLQNALLNIAINARDAMPQGGTMTFSTRAISLSAQDCGNPAFDLAPGGHVQICVIDTGHGMTPEVQRHLFEPFFTTKERGKGTGMGLAAVYGTVKIHKGAIKVRSEQGLGTTIELLFPCTAPKKKSSAVDSVKKEDTTASRSYRILLVDDEPGVQMTIAAMLTHLGHSVTAESNGKDAVEYYAKAWRGIDLVILDLIMPVMSGPEAFKELRKINPAVKILISSGYGIDGDAETLIAAGAKGFLEKPFITSDLSKAILQAVT